MDLHPLWFGLYGAFMRDESIKLGPFQLFRNPKAEPLWPSHENLYYLTGVGYFSPTTNSVNGRNQYVEDLAAAWSIAQHQDVTWGGPLEAIPAATEIPEVIADFEECLDLQRERKSTGWRTPLAAAHFFPAIEALHLKLQAPDATFRGSAYRAREALRLLSPVVDLRYYLQFSGIEMLARGRTAKFEGNVSVPIHEYLTDTKFGCSFNVVRDLENPLFRSVQSYCHVRNRLFHNGALSVTKRHNLREATFELQHYLLMLERLLPLALVRESGIEMTATELDAWTLPSTRNGPAGGWANALQ